MTFKAYSGTVKGPYHRKNDLPNQDAVAWSDTGDFIVAAVADGAGSLKHSGTGAQAAADTAVRAVLEASTDVDFEDLPELALLAAQARQKSFEGYKEYGSTLTVIVMTSDGYWASGAVGDSFGVIHRDEGEHRLVTGTPIGDYANITELLTSDLIHPIYEHGESADGFSLSSDGLEYVAIQGKEAHPGFWNGLVSKAEDGSLNVDRFLAWLESLNKLSDDTTLLTVVTE